MNKKKARLIAALFSLMLLGVLLNAGIMWPRFIPWLMAPFAITGAFKFVRVLYIWILTDPDAEEEKW